MTVVNSGGVPNTTANVAHKLLVAWVDSQNTALVGAQGQNIPLAQGGVVISAGANFASSGTVNFSNANGFTFGMDALGNITATVIPGAAAGVAAVQAGTQTQTSGTLVFSNFNGITFGLSNSSVLTASYTVPTQSVQTQASGAIAGTGFTSTTTAGVVIVGTNSTNGLSLGIPNYITTYVAQSTQTQPAGNIAGAGTTTTTQAGSTLGATQNSNGLSLAVPLWITTYVGQSTQTQPAGNIAGIGTTTTTQAGSTLGATLSTNGLSLAVPAWLTVAAGGGGFTGGVSTGGNTLGNTGSQTGSIFFAGGNNITLSVGTAAGGAQTITISGPNAGGAQTGISGIIVSNTTYTSGTVSFSNANGFSFGSSAGQAITGSYTVPVVTNSSWTVSDANTSATVGRLAFTQANGLTMSLSTSNNGNHTVFGSYTVPSTAGLISAVNISGNGTSGNVTQIVYSNLNGMTFGVSTAGGGPIGTVTASYTVPSVTQYFSNTGTTFNGANISGSMTLNTNGLQLSLSGGAGGGGGFTGGVSTGGNTLGNTGTQTGSVIFVGGNNITLSVGTAAGGAQTITISGPNAGGAQTGISSIQNSQTTYTSGAIKFLEGGGAITIASSTGQAFNFSVPQTSSLVGTSGISVSTAGSTISIIGGQGVNSRFVNEPSITQVGTVQGNSLVSIVPIVVENYLAMSNMRFGASISAASAANTSSAYFDASISAVLYSRNISTLSSILSGSNSYTLFAQSNSTSSLGGIQALTMSWGSSTVLPPGEYWVAVHVSTTNTATGGASTTALGRSLSMLVGASAGTAAMGLNPLGQAPAATQGASIGLGLISTGATLASIPFNTITQSGTAAMVAKLWLDMRNYSIW